MKFRKCLGLSFLVLALSSCAGGLATKTQYKPSGLFGGYSEKEVEPNIWRVEGRSNGIARVGFGRDMAMYRSAEIMKDQGFDNFHIIDQKGKSQRVNNSFSGETLKLYVVGHVEGMEVPPCRAKESSACFEVNVEEIIQRLGPSLGVENVSDINS